MAAPRNGMPARNAVRAHLSLIRSSLARHRLLRVLSTLSLLILLITQLLGNGPFAAASVAFAASKPPTTRGSLTFQKFLQLTNHPRPPVTRPRIIAPAPPAQHSSPAFAQLPPTAQPPTMQPITQPLSTAFLSGAPNTAPLDLVGSDHRLEIQVAAGSFDLSHASEVAGSTSGTHTPTTPPPSVSPTPAATSTPRPAVTRTPAASSGTPTLSPTRTATPVVTPTATSTPSPTPSPSPPPSAVSGPFTLVVTELHGQFVGIVSMLGSYQIQVLDGQQKPLTGIVLRHPLTVLYHYQRQDLTGLDLDPGKLFLAWYDPSATKQQAAQDIIAFQNTSTTRTLTAQSTVLHPGPFDMIGDPQNQSPPVVHYASVQGNAGQLSYSYPLQVAPGPDGFVPQLQLAYSSEATNEVHSYVTPAGPAGEGWALSLGSITEEPYPSTSANGTGTWFFLSGVDGISDRLIQDTTITNGTFFQTEHISHLRIQELNPTSATPCFAVWDESGAYYQFGCTQDSLQYRKDGDGTAHIYRFDLNEIIAPNEGQSSTEKEIQVSYLQECGSQSGSCPALTASGTTSIRDAGIKQIQYGTVPPGKTLDNGGSIDGTVDFHYLAPNAVTTWATAYSDQSVNYTCHGTPPASTQGMRCDDPQNYTGGNPAPTVMSTLTLSKVSSYVGPDNITDGSGGYPAYEYEFSYQDTPFSSTNPAQNNAPCADPTNPSMKEYCAGEHDLTQISPAVFQSGVEHTLKPVLFHYYSFTNTYSDRSNPLPGGAPYIVTIDRDFLDYYYDSDTGTGAHISYGRAYNNTHGTPDDPQTGDNRYDPLFCFSHAFDSYTCNDTDPNHPNHVFNYPDDRAWTAQVVTQITALSSDSGGLSAATTTYLYTLAKIPHVTCPADQANPPDTDCVGDNWLPENPANKNHDQDWADFYHGEFRGFNVVSTVSPSGDLTENAYYSTEGWWTPNGDAPNYNTGALYEQDIYQGGTATANALMQKTTSAYTGYTGHDSCDGLVNLTYVPCLIMAESTTTTFYEGHSSGPSVTTAYTYDDYSSTNGLSLYQYHNLDEEKITSTNAPEIDKLWSYVPNDSGHSVGSGWIYYDVNKVAHSEIDDTGSPVRKYQCTAYTYDEVPKGSPSEPTPDAGLATTTNTYTSATCTPGNFTSPLTTSYAGYDAYGNAVATVDGVATATAALYGSSGKTGVNGCTLSSEPVNISNAWSQGSYTTCTVYDSYNAQPSAVTNAFGQQTAQTTYDYTQGSLPIQVKDANSQITSTTYSYDANSGTNGKRMVQVSEPGEQSGSYTTQANSSSSCQTSIPSGTITPCYENDSLSSQYPNALGQTFYDANGRVVEASTPTAMPAGGTSGTSYYTIVLTMYNDAAHSVWKSLPFIYAGSASGAGWLDPTAGSTVDYKGNAPTGTITYHRHARSAPGHIQRTRHHLSVAPAGRPESLQFSCHHLRDLRTGYGLWRQQPVRHRQSHRRQRPRQRNHEGRAGQHAPRPLR